jgi:hypothetical protein
VEVVSAQAEMIAAGGASEVNSVGYGIDQAREREGAKEASGMMREFGGLECLEI